MKLDFKSNVSTVLALYLQHCLIHLFPCSVRMNYRGPGLQDHEQCLQTPQREKKELLLDLCLTAAALHEVERFHDILKMLLSLFSVESDLNNILIDCYHHVKNRGSPSVISKLRQLFKSAPAVWSINLSERKASILLEALEFQTEKKKVELTGCSDEESEVRSFLQCLPYISRLR